MLLVTGSTPVSSMKLSSSIVLTPSWSSSESCNSSSNLAKDKEALDSLVGLTSSGSLAGTSTIFTPLNIRVYLLVLPSCTTPLSNCQGRPSNKWQASIATTSHQTESL
ncbi:hypothetical protein Scep_025599 [Stephania cephalantha]|uniref:Uncharacterized protein n=1 Tax=Stephania cephalantha TaxID=152367 RepID=A0AAP0EL22_9MAGN